MSAGFKTVSQTVSLFRAVKSSQSILILVKFADIYLNKGHVGFPCVKYTTTVTPKSIDFWSYRCCVFYQNTQWFPQFPCVNIEFCCFNFAPKALFFLCWADGKWPAARSVCLVNLISISGMLNWPMKSEAKMAANGGQFWTSLSVPYACLYVSFSLPRDFLNFLKISLFENTYKICLQTKEMSLRISNVLRQSQTELQVIFSWK